MSRDQEASEMVDADYEEALAGPRMHSELLLDTLTNLELRYLPEMAGHEAQYLEMRAVMLNMWSKDTKRYLTWTKAADMILDHLHPVVRRVHGFLEQFGFINAGCLPSLPAPTERSLAQTSTLSRPLRVAVIGAGVSGVAAARQLAALGHSVTVLEAEHEIGGRVLRPKMADGSGVDLGASIVTGSVGNPIWTVVEQLGARRIAIRPDPAMFDFDGSPVDQETDSRFFKLYNDAMAEASRQVSEAPDEAPASLEAGIEQAIARLVAAAASSGDPIDVCPGALSRRLIDWHHANAEYGCSSELGRVSLAHWDQDDPYAFGGEHYFLPDGYADVLEELARPVRRDIRVGCEVREVRWGPGPGAQVRYLETGAPGAGGDQGGEGAPPQQQQQLQQQQQAERVLEADVVLVTVSLGVLQSGQIAFSPPLPEWKTEAAARLGWGNLNKVALLFPTCFWGDSADIVGVAREDPADRGEFFYFWNYQRCEGRPLLVGLAAGAASARLDGDENDRAVVDRALGVLRRVFGTEQVPEPVDYMVTRWGRSPHVLGSYSFVRTGATGDDYDAVARPVDDRLFFAGEATARCMPATVGGAYASGLRAAGEIDATVRAWPAVSWRGGQRPSPSASATSDAHRWAEGRDGEPDGRPGRGGYGPWPTSRSASSRPRPHHGSWLVADHETLSSPTMSSDEYARRMAERAVTGRTWGGGAGRRGSSRVWAPGLGGAPGAASAGGGGADHRGQGDTGTGTAAASAASLAAVAFAGYGHQVRKPVLRAPPVSGLQLLETMLDGPRWPAPSAVPAAAAAAPSPPAVSGAGAGTSAETAASSGPAPSRALPGLAELRAVDSEELRAADEAWKAAAAAAKLARVRDFSDDSDAGAERSNSKSGSRSRSHGRSESNGGNGTDGARRKRPGDEPGRDVAGAHAKRPRHGDGSPAKPSAASAAAVAGAAAGSGGAAREREVRDAVVACVRRVLKERVGADAASTAEYREIGKKTCRVVLADYERSCALRRADGKEPPGVSWLHDKRAVSIGNLVAKYVQRVHNRSGRASSSSSGPGQPPEASLSPVDEEDEKPGID